MSKPSQINLCLFKTNNRSREINVPYEIFVVEMILVNYCNY